MAKIPAKIRFQVIRRTTHLQKWRMLSLSTLPNLHLQQAVPKSSHHISLYSCVHFHGSKHDCCKAPGPIYTNLFLQRISVRLYPRFKCALILYTAKRFEKERSLLISFREGFFFCSWVLRDLKHLLWTENGGNFFQDVLRIKWKIKE